MKERSGEGCSILATREEVDEFNRKGDAYSRKNKS